MHIYDFEKHTIHLTIESSINTLHSIQLNSPFIYLYVQLGMQN